MAAELGATASILAITLFAFNTSKSFHDVVCSFNSRRKEVKDILTDLNSLVLVLESIHQHIQSLRNDTGFEPLREPLNCCTAVCQEMQNMLQECTKHTSDNNASIRDWLSMRFHEKSFSDMRQKLGCYKSTLTITFASVTLFANTATRESLDDLKRDIGEAKADLEDRLLQVGDAVRNTSSSLHATLLADQAQLRSCLDSLNEALRAAENTSARVVITENRAAEGSGALFGTDTSQPAFHLNVSGNEAQAGSRMAAGVHNPETLQALLRDSPVADVMLRLQSLSTQPASNHAEILQSMMLYSSATPSQRLVNESVTINGTNLSRLIERQDTSNINNELGSETVLADVP